MIKTPLFLIASLMAAKLACAYPRSDLPSVSFNHKDWELACDNTRTCRAAGYRGEDRTPHASLLLTRAAGPQQPVRAQLQLANFHSQTIAPSTLTMSVGRRSLGSVRIDPRSRTGALSAAQVQALLPALAGSDAIAWTSGKTSWTVSSAGASAVMLKMDEFQGRLDTVGALVRKGPQSEATVLPALPLPVIQAGPVARSTTPPSLSPTQKQAILAALQDSARGQDCDAVAQPDPQRDRLELRSLAPGKLLASQRCWSGAYNEGRGYWVVDTRPPYSAVLVTNKASSYANGVIESVQLGRGVGDCAARASWTWDGRSFAQTSALTTGMCRSVKAGGAWVLPTLVTRVQRSR